MNFKKHLIGPEVATPQMFDEVVKDRQVGDVKIQGFNPSVAQASKPEPFYGVGTGSTGTQVFPLSNRTSWKMSQPSFRLGSQDDDKD